MNFRIRLCAGAAALACAAGAAALPSRAEAADFMVSVMQDDNQLLYGTQEERMRALDYMRGLGVDAVRVTVLWESVAPRRRPKSKPTTDPAAYPRTRWDRYDDLVRTAESRGIDVYFNVTAPGPRWAHAKSPERRNQRTWKPSAREFGRFVYALGRRYSGRYEDESDGRRLPRVEWWGIFNEPNQGGWLTPQSQKVRGIRKPVPTSPALYRELLVEGAKALLRTRHGDDLILFGETAPLGRDPSSERRPLRPALFLREMFCLDSRLRRYRGRQARARDCQRVERLKVLNRLPRLAYGHHPYTKDLPPTKRDRHRDAISMANIRDLPVLLDRLSRRSRAFPKGIGVMLTEFGYETNPPDPFNGVSPEEQADFLNVADYIAYRNPRVFATTQFQLFDVPPQGEFKAGSRRYWFTYQSGLFTADRQPKPAADAYMLPFEARPAGDGKAFLWGQVRFTENGAPQTVLTQMRRPGSGAWETVGQPVEVRNQVGFWSVTRSRVPAGAAWRALWVSPDGSQTRASREIMLP